MKKQIIIALLFLIYGMCFVEILNAQGISRSTGLGLRVGFWQHDNSVKDYPVGTVAASGAGSLYFFSRLKGQWFMEASIGGVGESEIGLNGVLSTSLTALTMGARYDLLSSEYNSMLQPYLAFGGGAYLLTRSAVGLNVIADTKTQPGIYLGAGANAILSTRFGLNADIKYHAIRLADDNVPDYSGMEFSMGVSFMWGSTPEIFEIEQVNLIVQDIYPAYYQFYNTYPLAQVVVKNTAGHAIEVNVHSSIAQYSERKQESGFIKIEAGEKSNIPVLAVFDARLLQTKERTPAVIDLQVEVRRDAVIKKEVSLNILIHSRNAWNGQIDKLGFFITPDEEEIMKFSSKVIHNQPTNTGTELNDFATAQAIFEELQNLGIRYQTDPNIPFYKDDYVQFATETISKKSGDCDDLVVLYASLLESVGIETAFIQVQDPEKALAHLYLIFDTGIPADKSQLVSTNEKRFIIRRNHVWLPVETTLIKNGFDVAWETGAMTYLQEGVIRSGLANGWVRVIDID